MSNDKTTLADVQPGGRVRLGDAPWPEIDAILADAYSAGAEGLPFEGIARRAAVRAAVAALSAQPSPGGRRFHHVSEVAKHFGMAVTPEEMGEAIASAPSSRFSVEAAAAAFSKVKPSPGGQGDALVQEALEYFERAGDAGDRKYVAAIRAELAARQPVGEPVTAIGVIDEDEGGFVVQLYPSESLPVGAKVYAAPPAQAVDLGQLRAKLRDAVKLMDAGFEDEAGEVTREALALTDSQAVSNG
ncbi:hypothetical protein I5U05_015795 [Stenotrophomonas maltophilia]|nr:hypothetical protein [Stenotrophomonas maltophilia]MBH1726316.1 hypothetical protein [Stenotrophomonas maltophilia]MBH1800304.1 hypothetical protein [Stenotrophomonas maltophilia]MBH1807322.1 hypothetical protein [Stenotrophomonas maltophilia]